MLIITRNRISLTRGDTAVLQIALRNSRNETYHIRDGDELVFTLKKTTHTNEILISKSAVEMTVKLFPEDTKNMDYGLYIYDIQLKKESGEICTVVPPSVFEIMEEVNYG